MVVDPSTTVVQVAFTTEALEAFIELLNGNKILSPHGCRLSFRVSYYEPKKATLFIEEHCSG